ncbi:MAG: tetratricopeptide repeat protein [Prevotella sp.]|nr:tetratricopeptide repeat protein [Prevotella sp.]
MAMLMSLAGCSTQKNTAKSRWWHSFNARYNTYFNGSQAYIDGSLEKENGHKDNFTEMIPLYTVSSKSSKETGKGNFDKAIEKSKKAIKQHSITHRPEWNKNRKKTAKDIEWLNRREYNPFLWKAWMLMGRSQFHEGAFEDAASTFAYMSRLYATQPAIYGKARAWLAKCYIEQDWIYDAEDVITKMQRDSLDWRAVKEWDYTYADYYIHLHQYEKAIPYLKKVIRHEMRRKQKAREWFLMGQLQAAVGNRNEAYNAFRKVIRMNPPYELEFNARIAMTEVMAGTNARQMISRLKRMASSEKNTEYLDQVYYAIGNIYLMQRDTIHAIDAYEKGNTTATRSGIEKGVLLLRLGDLYWAKERFSDAQRCYGEAIGLLDKDRDDYEQLSERSKILDELVPYTEAVHLQDSLQELARMPEAERLAAIDKVIEALKKKEKEEERAQQEMAAQQQMQQQGAVGNRNAPVRQTTTQGNQNATWYFYNPMAVIQGKTNFEKMWGKRENVDNWQRVNKTVVAGIGNENMSGDNPDDLLSDNETPQDSLTNAVDSAVNDPHKREYYLAQIPLTEEQMLASHEIIKDGLYNSGVIFKDKLNHLTLSERNLQRILTQYPDYEHLDKVYYHLWLLYQRQGNLSRADQYLSKLKSDYPNSEWTALLSNPYYIENARFGEHLEDSLYTTTYEAFKKNDFLTVHRNTRVSAERFPQGENRDKFIFIQGMTLLNEGNSKGCLENMETVVREYPQSSVSELAGMIINGVKGGRRIHGGTFDMENIWERRMVMMSDSDSVAVKEFTVERNDPFVFIFAYEPDSVNENQLLFELARYNFTNFLVRNFEIQIEEHEGLHRMMVSGFRSYDEVLQYARQMLDNERIRELTHKCRKILISEPNLALLGTQFSYKEYDEFYEQHFIPIRISTVRLLTEPENIEYQKQPEPDPADKELYKGGVVDDGMLIDLGISPEGGNGDILVIPEEEESTKKETVAPVKQNEPDVIVPEQNVPTKRNESEIIIKEETDPAKRNQSDIIILEEPVTPAVKKQDNKTTPDISIPVEEKPVTIPATKPVSTPVTKPAASTAAKPAASTAAKPASSTATKPASPATKPVATGKTPVTTVSTKNTTNTKNTGVKTQRQPLIEDTGIDFNDGFGNAVRKKNDTIPAKKKTATADKKTETKKIPNLEDEYYELEGF